MSPEERARAVADELWNQVCEGDVDYGHSDEWVDEGDCRMCVEERIAAVIRAAENDALERAAKAVSESLELEGYLKHEPDTDLTREAAAEIVRSLKIPSPRRGEGEPTP